jgi:hypothetical protein
MLQGAAAAKRLQISADNAADSYARSMRQAADALAAKEALPAKNTSPAVKKVKKTKT